MSCLRETPSSSQTPTCDQVCKLVVVVVSWEEIIILSHVTEGCGFY